MTEVQELTNWSEGFIEAANKRGVTDPQKIAEYMKLAHALEAREQNPEAFQAAYDAQMQKRAAMSFAQKAKLMGLLGLGGMGAIGAKNMAEQSAEGIHDMVDSQRMQDLIKLQAQMAATPGVRTGGGTPFSNYRM